MFDIFLIDTNIKKDASLLTSLVFDVQQTLLRVFENFRKWPMVRAGFSRVSVVPG